MNNKIVRPVEDRVCQICGKQINKGDEAEYFSFKTGRFDANERQIGIQFYRFWIHYNPECDKKEIEWFNLYSGISTSVTNQSSASR